MRHIMRLHNEPFILIKKGTKTIEMRLNDEKRQLIKVGDTIEFINRYNNDIIYVEVINLYYFNNFEDLYDSFDKTSIGYNDGDEGNPNDMKQYYSNEEINKFGVLAIEIKLL